MENLFETDCIRTFTGLYMNVFEPTPEMICIEDIAHALSYMPRFGGHLPVFYSVAQHSLRCAHKAMYAVKNVVEGGDKSAGFEALLHDASEAYIMDIPSPIKKRLPEYKKIEENLMRVIAEKFGFTYPLSAITKQVDHAALVEEWDRIMMCKDRFDLHRFDRIDPDDIKKEFVFAFNYYRQ